MTTPAADARPQAPLLPWTLSFLRPYRGRVALLAVLLVSEIGLGALQPWPLAVVIDYVLGSKAFPTRFGPWLNALHASHRIELLVLVVLAGVVLQVVNQFVSAYGTQVQVDTGQRMVYDLRRRLFEHLTALGLHHHITTSTADAVYRVDVDAYAIENLVMSGLFPLATSIISLVVMFGILLRLNETIALLSLSVVPFLYLCLRYYTSTLVNREERVKELESKLLERLYETFGAMRLVKSFAREPHELGRYAAAGDRTMNARIAITWQQSLFSVVVSTITILGTALVVIVGGSFVMRDRLTIGELIVVINYLGAVYGPLSAIAHTTGQLQGAFAGTRRVRAMFALMPETVDAPDAVDASGVTGHIRFEDVSFQYPDGTKVLHDIGFEANPGEMVALVGLTGAGKTTLVSLIPRFYEATSGRVLVDGVDVRKYRVRSLREKIAIVLQDPVLFSGSIADNLRYGRLDATPQEIEEAAHAAHAHEFIARLAEGVRHRDRRSRRRAVGRRAPAAERGARDPQERADPHPRRADLVARRDLRGDRVRGPPPPAREPHDGRHRAPPVDGEGRRPHPRPRRRPHRRAGAARRPAQVQPAVPSHVRPALGGQVARRARNGRRAHRGGEALVKILFAGIIARYPFGGVTWCSLMYLLGLRALGHEVFYIEDTGECVYDPVENTRATDPSYGTTYINNALAPFGLGDRWTFVNYDGRYHGRSAEDVRRYCAEADLFINLSGGSWFWRDEYARIPRKAFIDSDPAFTQLAIAKAEPWYVEFFRRFDRLFTFGSNVGTPASPDPGGRFRVAEDLAAGDARRLAHRRARRAIASPAS